MRGKQQRSGTGRRKFVFGSVIGLFAAMVGWPVWVRLFSVSGPPPSSGEYTDAGPIDAFADGRPTPTLLSLPDVAADRRPLVFVSRRGVAEFRVLSSICPHRSCLVDFMEGESLYRCACHNSWFEGDGDRGGGPAPRGMDPLPWRIENGRLLVQWQLYRPDTLERVAI